MTLVQSRTSCYYADGTVTNNIYYDYDAFNRLVHRYEDPDGDGPSGFNLTYYLHDGTNPILQFDGQQPTDLSHRYLFGPAVDQILADETVDDGSVEDILWPLLDFQGSVRHLAKYDPQTITTTIVNHKFYDTFGNLTHETNPTISHLFAFTGRPFDATTGLQNNLNRWYDPKLGRWLSEDPISFAAGDPNLYRYVGNHPTSYIDPAGLEPYSGSVNGGSQPTLPSAKRLMPPSVRRMLDRQCIDGCSEGLQAANIGSSEFLVQAAREGKLIDQEELYRRYLAKEKFYFDHPWFDPRINYWELPHEPPTDEMLIDLVLGFSSGGLNNLRYLPAAKKLYTARKAAQAAKVARASKYGAGFFDDLAKQATRNADSGTLVLGKTLEGSVAYTKVAAHYRATYFKLDNWRGLSGKLSRAELWKINEAFLDQQIKAGKQIIFSHDPLKATGFFADEIMYLEQLGYSFVQDGWVWKAVKP